MFPSWALQRVVGGKRGAHLDHAVVVVAAAAAAVAAVNRLQVTQPIGV